MRRFVALSAAACSLFALSTAASAERVITNIGADLSAGDFTFDRAGGGSFTFGFTGDFFNGPVTIRTANGGEVNTVFGEPSSNFVDRGVVTFGPGMNYAAFSSETVIRFTNGNNFIGLRAIAANGDAFYGYAFSTNNVLNTIGFETIANTTITATTAAAVPEPASWTLMIGGFGLAGAALRRRSTKVSFA